MSILSSRNTVRRGFSLAELLAVIVILGILAAMSTPRFYRTVSRAKVNQAVGIVAGDLEQAVSLAARRRAPVTLDLESSTAYTLRDRVTSGVGTLRLRRSLALSGDQGVNTIAFSRTPVQLFPNGTTDGALTVTLTGAGFSRTVTLSAAGQVRIQ
jgi:prepilin-type N-terminal cleavage/methylation domain-containing protein